MGPMYSKLVLISVILYEIILISEGKVDSTSTLPLTSGKPGDEKRARFLGLGLGDASFSFGLSKHGGFPFSGGIYGQGFGHHHHHHGFGIGGLGAYGGGFGAYGINPYFNQGYFGGGYGFKHQFQHGFGYPGGYYGGIGLGGFGIGGSGYGFH